jgi:ketosteroid isomerase-like protein/carbon monoxide dehydrogenase subunit G
LSVVTRIRTSHEVTVPSTPEEVWSVIADVAAYPKWWPALRGVTVLRHEGGLVGSEFEVRPFLGRTFRVRFEELEGHQSVRLRFFGGSLEGPGGFHLREADHGTQIRYEMDVFTRGMKIAVLSQVLPYEWIHRARMRSVLRRLTGRLKVVRRAAARKPPHAITPKAPSVPAAPPRVAPPPPEVATSEAAGGLWARVGQWLAAPAVEPKSTAVVGEFASGPPSQTSESNFDTARRYLDVLSSRAAAAEIAPFLAPSLIQEEFPHRFLDGPQVRSPEAILEARGRALSAFASERHELAAATGGGSQVAMELRWRGTDAAGDGGGAERHELDARMAMFLKFEDGRIVRQRIYSCFEPWSTPSERKAALAERAAWALPGRPASPGPLAAPAQPETSNFDIARSYLAALGSRAGAETIAGYFTSGALQEEFPNRLLPEGAHRDLSAIKLARARGLAFLSSENYELLGATGSGSMVALEVSWTGMVGESVGPFKVGQRLQARTAIFLEFHKGLIAAQRNYPCA